jgi:transposase
MPKGGNGLRIALRQAANAISNLRETHLSDFFRRIAYRKGRLAALSATARKLAGIIRHMLTYRLPYSPPAQYLFLVEKRKLQLVQGIRKNIAKLNLKPEDVGFAAAC